MASVTKRLAARVLASAPGDCFGFCDFNLLGTQAGPFMRAITKGLAFGSATRTPPVGAWRYFLYERRSLANDGFAHKCSAIKMDWDGDFSKPIGFPAGSNALS